MNIGTLLALSAAALCYFAMSALVSQIGVTSAPMAQHFGMSITETVPLFSFLTGGSFVGVFISLFIFRYFSVQQVFLICSGLLVIAAGGNYLFDDIALIPVVFLLLGIAGGVGMSVAAVTIAGTVTEQHRASLLVGADLFYSAGGYLIVIVASALFARGFIWSSGYLAVGLVSMLVFLLALGANFPVANDDTSNAGDDPAKEPWRGSVYLIGVALFCYVAGQNAFIVWTPSYLGTVFSLPLEQAGAAVSNYWGAGMFGLVISALILQKISAATFLLVITAAGALVTALLTYTASDAVFFFGAAILGLITIGSIGSMISLGVHQQTRPSITLVPFLLCCAAAGGTVSPIVSSYVVGITGVGTSISLVFTAYLAVFLILSLVVLRRNDNSAPNPECPQESV